VIVIVIVIDIVGVVDVVDVVDVDGIAERGKMGEIVAMKARTKIGTIDDGMIDDGMGMLLWCE
jgi:hypothetical protein